MINYKKSVLIKWKKDIPLFLSFFIIFSLVFFFSAILSFLQMENSLIPPQSETTYAKKAQSIPAQSKVQSVTTKSQIQYGKSELLVPSVTVYRTKTGQTETIDFESYVKGVVASEMPANFELEALKAQAVAARTYSLSKIIRSGGAGNPSHPSAPLCDSTHCQVYRDKAQLESANSTEWMDSGWTKIEKAVDSTKGELMFYKDELVAQALFHSASGGKTENSEDVFVTAIPYLRSVDSISEDGAPHKEDIIEIDLHNYLSPSDLSSLSPENVKILSRNQGGQVSDMQIGTLHLSGKEARNIFSLPSADFEIHLTGNILTFNTHGYGHGVGMSQWGANGMAKEGKNYKKILSHYYSGIEFR